MVRKDDTHTEAMEDKAEDTSEVDVFRDTPLRYLGYANEVGEALRNIIRLYYVRLSYAVAGGYVLVDACHKTWMASVRYKPGNDGHMAHSYATSTFVDSLAWQSLASVIIPGLVVNRSCMACNSFIKLYATSIPIRNRHVITTIFGLALIPFIIRPIDRFVDGLMDDYISPTTQRLVNSLYSENSDFHCHTDILAENVLHNYNS